MKSTSFSKFLSIFPLLILPIQSTVLGQEADAAADSTVTYPASYFAQFSPVSVNDMLDRIPGIELVLQGEESALLSRFRGGNRGLGGSSQILIDGKLLDEKNLSSWHSKIGYVGQEGFLSDDTITKNIAFGVENEKIDIKKVVKSAKLAEIDDFIEKQLENKYDTIVGERGIRLSGGQRQRLRIARAFYRDPNILILDEATNALDASTEEKVMESIKKLSKNLTVILISHRISMLKNCDKIALIEDNKIADEGNYEYLQKNNMLFKVLLEKQKNNLSNESFK